VVESIGDLLGIDMIETLYMLVLSTRRQGKWVKSIWCKT